VRKKGRERELIGLVGRQGEEVGVKNTGIGWWNDQVSVNDFPILRPCYSPFKISCFSAYRLQKSHVHPGKGKKREREVKIFQ
jgi:hypothetical protein